MKYNNILVTGGAGFVGSNVAVSFKKKYGHVHVIVMDNLKRRGSELNLTRLKTAGVEFIHGDIRNPEDFRNINFDVMIECSAEPSVMAGYDGSPLYVINTNLAGTINCLEEVRKKRGDIIFLSTSRVYPYDNINAIEITEEENRFVWKEEQSIYGWSPEGISEEFSLKGARSLYGASKLCSELILQEYISMYGIGGVINRCGVIAGPWQFGKVDQGVFTHWMIYHYFRKEGLKYIGFNGLGKQVRDLIHVDDIFELIDMELKDIKGINGKIYNAGGSLATSLSLKETTELCQEITGNKITITGEPTTRPADLAIYIGDNTCVTEDLKWQPRHSGKKILEDIYSWIRNNEQLIAHIY